MTAPHSLLDASSNKRAFGKYIKPLLNKELLLTLYISLFIFGVTTQDSSIFYNEYRAVQIVLLLLFGLIACFNQRDTLVKGELVFFGILAIGSVFWAQPTFVITELLLVYLLYKSFGILRYRELTSKLLVLSSLTMFIQFPLALWDYVQTGKYAAIWYPLEWNIRVYDSYFLLISIFAVWFYLTNQAYRYVYLCFLFLVFLAVLLDGGRSSTIAYTLFIAIVSIAYSHIRWHLILTYAASWLAYISVTYAASFASGANTLRIVRESSSGRMDLWVNAYQCWLSHPIIGCGFYQLERHPNLSAHPHNLFIQILTETGLLGFGLLIYIILMMIRRIDWAQPHCRFIMAALLAIGIDSFFSGVHIYPVTQMALLWVFVFLLKNPEFMQARLAPIPPKNLIANLLPSLVYIMASLWFVDLLINTSLFLSRVPFTPPRFWVYGYRL